MNRSFASRMAALERLEGQTGGRAALRSLSADERYYAAGMLMDACQVWDFGAHGYGPHYVGYRPTDAFRAHIAGVCAQIGLDDWTLDTIYALCRWLNHQEVGERAARIAAARRLGRALARLTDAEIEILADAPESDAARALLDRALRAEDAEPDVWM